MIQLPNNAELKELQSFHRPHCLSAYIAFGNSSGGQNHDRIEYKNILHKAETMLADAGMNAKFINESLAPMRILVDSPELRPPKHESLAIFAHPELFRIYRLPAGSVQSAMTVRRGFSTGELQAVLEQNKSYFVLALSRKKARLYKGDRYGLEPVEVKDMPPDMETALQIDEYPHSRQFHSITPESRGAGSAHTHDQAEVKNTDKEMAFEFFRLIDKHIKPILTDSKLPLIVGGVENLLALYKKANSYSGLAGAFIHGNLDHSNPDTIRAKAWPIASTTLAAPH